MPKLNSNFLWGSRFNKRNLVKLVSKTQGPSYLCLACTRNTNDLVSGMLLLLQTSMPKNKLHLKVYLRFFCNSCKSSLNLPRSCYISFRKPTPYIILLMLCKLSETKLSSNFSLPPRICLRGLSNYLTSLKF